MSLSADLLGLDAKWVAHLFSMASRPEAKLPASAISDPTTSTASSVKQGCGSSRVVVIIRLLIFQNCRFNLLTHFWIDRVLLFSDSWHSKADCQPREG